MSSNLLQWAECAYRNTVTAESSFSRIARYKDGLLIVRTYLDDKVKVLLGSDCCGQPVDQFSVLIGGHPVCSYCGVRFRHGGLDWSSLELNRTKGWAMERGCIGTDQAVHYLMKIDSSVMPYGGLLLAQELCYELTTDSRNCGVTLQGGVDSIELFIPSGFEVKK